MIDIVHSFVGDSGLLKKHQPELVQYIHLQSLFPYLIHENLLTGDEQEMLLNTQFTERKRILKLLALVEKKGKDGFESFLKALEEEPEHLGHKELVTLLRGTSISGEAQNCIIGCVQSYPQHSQVTLIRVWIRTVVVLRQQRGTYSILPLSVMCVMAKQLHGEDHKWMLISCPLQKLAIF